MRKNLSEVTRDAVEIADDRDPPGVRRPIGKLRAARNEATAEDAVSVNPPPLAK